MKDKEHKKKLLPPPLTFRQQVEIHLPDLFHHLLYLREPLQSFFDFGLQFSGDRNLPHSSISETDRKNPDRSVAFPFALLTKATTRFVAAYHSAQ